MHLVQILAHNNIFLVPFGIRREIVTAVKSPATIINAIIEITTKNNVIHGSHFTSRFLVCYDSDSCGLNWCNRHEMTRACAYHKSPHARKCNTIVSVFVCRAAWRLWCGRTSFRSSSCLPGSSLFWSKARRSWADLATSGSTWRTATECSFSSTFCNHVELQER